ncbi:MAG: rhodanese-like domain-containing protein [Chloroflexota bacterium]
MFRPSRRSTAALWAVLVLAIAGCAASPTSSAPGGTAQAGAASGATPANAGEMTISAPGGTYTGVSPGRLTEMLRTKDFLLINVHVPYAGEIEGTDAFLPYDQVTSRSSELPSAKDARIVVYCRSGRMSTEAARTLVGLGYTNVWELDGGMIDWEKAGYGLVQNPGT